MRDLKLTRFICFLCAVLSALHLFSIEIDIIKNPAPNLKERQYVYLQKVKVIGADLGSDEFLFKPDSLTIDEHNHLYVYDNLQARIFKFSGDFKLLKAFGNKGRGPGEFTGTGLSYMVVIKVGRDGKLYANDIRSGKTIVFNQNGEYIRDFRYKMGTMVTPLADSRGNVYFTSVKKGTIDVLNEKQAALMSFDYGREDFNYLLYQPEPKLMKLASQNPSAELLMDLTLDSTLLVYFQNSSTMVVMKNKRAVNKIRIWPEEALASYKTEMIELLKQNKEMFKKMFPQLFVDEDNGSHFYLQLGRNRQRNINGLYQFNLRGELLKVFYVRLNEPCFTRFEAKKNDLFYAIEDEKITIYKEEKK